MSIEEAKKNLDAANRELTALFGNGVNSELIAGLEKCNSAFRDYCKANGWS